MISYVHFCLLKNWANFKLCIFKLRIDLSMKFANIYPRFDPCKILTTTLITFIDVVRKQITKQHTFKHVNKKMEKSFKWNLKPLVSVIDIDALTLSMITFKGLLTGTEKISIRLWLNNDKV